MNHQSIELEKTFYGDYCEWEATIPVTISATLEAKMGAMRALIRETDYVHSIAMDVPSDFLSDETEALLQDQCRFDVCRIEVFAWGFVFCLQGKYDSHIQAEYTLL